jgi:colanic acid/amylovoran/stewartan biosynthesis glycosyltransferase WcaL/AmsK/CpsK
LKKSVAIKINAFPQISETFVVSNIIYAIRQGFKVKVFCNSFLGISNSSQKDEFQSYGIYDKIVPPIKPKQSTLRKCFQLFTFLIKPRNLYFTFKYRSYKHKGFFNCAFTLKQYEDIRFNQVFHVHFNSALQPLMDITNIGYIHPKIFITFHGYDAFVETEESFQATYGAFYKKYVNAVTVNSNYLKQVVLGLGVEERLIRVIPIGLDRTIFKGTEKTINNQQEIKILTVGRLVQLKGQLYGLRAIKRLIVQGFKIHYTIVGEGTERIILENETKRLELEDYITFTGASSQSQVMNYMKKSHIFLMTSTIDDQTGRREAFGLVSVEAQAMGLPVIGFNSGGFPDTIIEGETGFAVEDRNDKDLADKVLHLLDNPNLYQAMSKAAIQHSVTFDQSRTTQQYLDLYEELK